MKKRWKIILTVLLSAALAGTSACGTQSETAAAPEAGSETVTETVTETVADSQETDNVTGTETAAAEPAASEPAAEVSGGTVITLSDAGSTVSGSGASVDGSVIRITGGGTYTISGTLSEGQIYVEADSGDKVTLVLNGMSIANSTEAAIDIEQADEVRVQLTSGTENLIRSGQSMPSTVDEDASGGALYSRDDLTITGNGSLTVYGYIKDGIHGNDDLVIESGTVTVEAAHHAVKTNDLLTVSGGTLNLTSNTDGLHSEGELEITGGDITISCGDDAIHADLEIAIEDGSIEIVKSYEGIEANQIRIAGGVISVTASDDGINANGGSNNMGIPGGGRFGFDASGEDTVTETPNLTIDGGNIYINAGGDGLDSNGNLTVNDGVIIVDGPESSANGAIDSGTENGGSCTVNGGTVLAIGASGMAEGFSSSSEQNSFRLTVGQSSAGTQIRIEDENGNELFSHTSAKSFSSIVFSSPDLKTGTEYTVTVGSDSITFTQTDGAYTSGGGGMGDMGSMGDIGGRGDRSGSQKGGAPSIPDSGSAGPNL